MLVGIGSMFTFEWSMVSTADFVLLTHTGGLKVAPPSLLAAM